MKNPVECETAAIATVTQIDYDDVNKAIGRIESLPDSIENPIFGNPFSLYVALIRLGYWKKNITLNDLINGNAEPMKTIVLVKKSLFEQHWVVYAGKENDNYKFFWGTIVDPVYLTKWKMVELFTKDTGINCAFQVYKSNILRRAFMWLMFSILKLFD